MSIDGQGEYGTPRDYELLARSIYENLLRQEGVENIEVRHDEKLIGRSGVTHQIDVLWRLRRAGVEHLVLIECKKYKSSVELGDVQSFSSVVDDINGAQGVMVTTVGFQSGARDFARHNGIGLKLLRKPSDADWEGRVKTININLFVQTIDHRYPAEVNFRIPQAAKSQFEGKRLKGDPLEVRILDSNGSPTTSPMKNWIRQVGVSPQDENGIVSGTVPLQGSYLRFEDSKGAEVLIPVESVDIRYRVQVIKEGITIDGGAVVKYILKDFITDEPDFLQR